MNRKCNHYCSRRCKNLTHNTCYNFFFSFFPILKVPQLSLEVDMEPWRNRISASISCEKVEHVYPTDAYVDECWWIHPDGRNISQNSNNHMIVYDRKTCKITLNRK